MTLNFRTFMAALVLLALVGLCATRAHAQTVTLTATPSSGISPLNVTLTWNSSAELTTCTANGAWSGTKPANGTQVVPVTADSTFGITCSTSTGTAQASWTAPTQNTDNSAIPATGPGSLAGFKLYQASSVAGLNTATAVDVPGKTTTSYLFTGLPAGTRYFAVTAYTVAGVESALSATANKLIVLPSATASASVTVNTQPKPPILTIATTAFELRQYSNGTLRFVNVGTVPLNVACGQTLVGKYAAFTGARITKPTSGGIIAAKCAAG